jgi:riboflavin biosynthesis pyrimidine reductase
MTETDALSTEITRIWPAPTACAQSLGQLADWYSIADRATPWVRMNFVTSLDGSATRAGLSGGLSGDADHAVFDILRWLCDVVVVGAGTVRAEGYGAMRVDEAGIQWRKAHGLAPHPTFAMVSARLDLDPQSSIFQDAPVRPIVFTAESAPTDARRALEQVADVVSCGESLVDPVVMIAQLVERGLPQVHCEGGPHLFGSMILADRVDELCLTLSPLLTAGYGPRISGGDAPEIPVTLGLAQVLSSEDTLILRYLRQT